jgi:hypothetical protein
MLILAMSSLALWIPNSYADTDPGVGTGTVYAHTDAARTIEVSSYSDQNYGVLPGQTYYFNITRITEFKNMNIFVWAKYDFNHTSEIDEVATVHVGEAPSNIIFEWKIPNLPILQSPISIKVMYGTGFKGDANSDHIVNSLDIGAINCHWCPAGGAPPWSLGYNATVDTNDDGYINSLDIGTINANWGNSWWYASKSLQSYGARLMLVVPEVFLGPISAIAALFSGLGLKKHTRRKRMSSS